LATTPGHEDLETIFGYQHQCNNRVVQLFEIAEEEKCCK
jgi:hypothetical protein